MNKKERRSFRFALALILSLLITAGCKKDASPGQVTDLTATPGVGMVNLTWTEPGDGDLKHTEIEITPGGFLPLEVPAGYNSVDISGLTNGTEYTFALTSVDQGNNRSKTVTITALPNTVLVITDPDQDSYNPAGVPTFSLNGENQLEIAVTFNRPVKLQSLVPGETIYVMANSNVYTGAVEMSNDDMTVTFTTTDNMSTICSGGGGDCLFTFHVIGLDTGNGTVEDTGDMVLDGDEDGEPGGDYVLNLRIIF